MTKQFLDKRDTDYVRDNLIFNYILGNEQELLIEGYVRNNGIEICFDPKHFYFFMTGVHKRFTAPFTPDSFKDGISNVCSIYEQFSNVLKSHGYTGRAFQIKEDNSKQFGVLFSPMEPRISADKMALCLYDMYCGIHGGSLYLYDSTSFVGPYSGYEQLHQAFLDARELNDLRFFSVRDVVITKEYREKTARPCDISAIHANERRLTTAVCTGTQAQALKQADYIIRELIAPSYEMDNFTAMFTAVDDLLGMLCTVYPEQVRIERRAQDDFFTLENYHTWLKETLCTLFAQLKGTPRYSPTILMALSYINRNYTRDLSLTQLSEYVYANTSVLSSQFNDEVGMSLSEYVTGLRIKKAQELLHTTNLTVPEISSQIGFTSAKYFREIFKKNTGLSPQGYRENSTN